MSKLDAFTVRVPLIGDVTLADAHILNADLPSGLDLALDGRNGIVATLAFDAPNMQLEVTVRDSELDFTDVTFQTLQLELTIDFDGRVTVDVQVVASATIAGNFVDLSDTIRFVLLQKIAQGLPSQLSDPALVKRALLAFMANLMRLNNVVIKDTKALTLATGQILDVAIANRALVASYFLVPVQSHSTT